MNKDRLESLDALRGFDMLLIMGLGPVVVDCCVLLGFGSDCFLARQFAHVEWNGLRLEDTIFPLFLFLAGVSWPFSLAAQRKRGRTNAQIILRCLRRAALLFLLGLVYNGLLEGTLRMGAVLSRIGVAWCVGAVLSLYLNRKILAVLAVGIPIAYWLLLYFVPAPDALTLVVPPGQEIVRQFGTGPFSIVGNLSGWIDRHFMPGILCPYVGIADNQSALGYIPAVGTALLGILFGGYIRETRETLSVPARSLRMLCVAVGLVALGAFIAFGCGGMSMPVNKKLWSASFTFIVGGYSAAMLALFHLVFDGFGCPRLSFFFRVIGMNAITIYLARRIVPFDVLSNFFFGAVSKAVPPSASALVISIGVVVLGWAFLYFLYRKDIFLKV